MPPTRGNRSGDQGASVAWARARDRPNHRDGVGLSLHERHQREDGRGGAPPVLRGDGDNAVVARDIGDGGGLLADVDGLPRLGCDVDEQGSPKPCDMSLPVRGGRDDNG